MEVINGYFETNWSQKPRIRFNYDVLSVSLLGNRNLDIDFSVPILFIESVFHECIDRPLKRISGYLVSHTFALKPLNDLAIAGHCVNEALKVLEAPRLVWLREELSEFGYCEANLGSEVDPVNLNAVRRNLKRVHMVEFQLSAVFAEGLVIDVEGWFRVSYLRRAKVLR